MRITNCLALGLTLLAGGLLAAAAAEPVRSAAPAPDPKVEPVRFRWALGAYEGAEGRLVPIRDSATLSTNAAVAMLVEPKSPCYVYVLLETGDGEYEWHFPGHSPAEVEQFHKQSAYYIPPPPMGLRLATTNGATSRLFVFASAQRQKDLEASFAKYQAAAPGTNKDLCASDLATLLEDLLKKRGAQSYAPPDSGDLALRAGTPPANPDSAKLDSIAREITTPAFFAQSFTLQSTKSK